MNKWIGIGRLTKDPETRRSNDTVVCRFNLAVDRRYKKDDDRGADFISCVAFGKTAEFIEKYGHKGIKFVIEGRIQTVSYTKQDGTKAYATDVIIETVEFAESKKEDKPSADGFLLTDNADDFNPFISKESLC